MPSIDSERRRRATRLRGYDYRTPGLYHVVTGTKDRICRFGEIRDHVMHPNDIGLMIDEIWNAIPERFPTVSLDASVVMPNHFHGMVFIEPQPGDVPGVSLGDIMKWFKTVITVRYSRGVHEQGWPPYERKVWHRNYYEHIVRDDRDLERIRGYIEGNPANWDSDRHYPMPE
jgi:putative transposase